MQLIATFQPLPWHEFILYTPNEIAGKNSNQRIVKMEQKKKQIIIIIIKTSLIKCTYMTNKNIIYTKTNLKRYISLNIHIKTECTLNESKG